MASDEEDDPVVEEIDVFLSKQLSDNLLLLQYPVRPGHMTYDNTQHLAARVKPKQLKLELELAINTKSPSYARSKGEQIAVNVDGANPGDNPFYLSDRMDKQVLSSLPVGLDAGRYVLGSYRDKELHLTPLKGMLQMRPSFGYLDKVDAKNKEKDDLAKGGDSQDEEEDAKQVMVKFARQETEESKARRMASYDFLRKKQEEERWTDIDCHQIDEPMSEAMRCMLYARQSSETSEFFMNPSDYLKNLMPAEKAAEEKRPAMPNNILSMVELKTMALNDQVKALLMSAKVIRFSQLMSLLQKGSDPTAVLRIVQQVALLVQGCWVVKSEVLYPKDSFSAHSGVPAETLSRGRDYIMWRFTQSRHLVRKDISSVIKLPAEDVKDILEQMARLKVNKGWEFLMDFDTEFVNRHVEVVQRQQMLWERKFQQLSSSLNITKADIKLAANAAAAASTMTSPKRRRTVSRSRTKSGGDLSMSDLSDMDIDSKSERHRHSSSSERHRRLSGPVSSRQRKISLMDFSSEEPPIVQAGAANANENGVADLEMALESPNHTASDSHNGNAPVDPGLVKTELLQFATDRLYSRFVLSISDYKELFTRKLAECPPGHILGSGVSDKALEQSLMDIGARQIPASLNIPENIYVRDKLGDGKDDIRSVMFDLFHEKLTIRINVFRKKIEEAGLEVPPDPELRKILKDYCNVKGGQWVIKCSVADIS